MRRLGVVPAFLIMALLARRGSADDGVDELGPTKHEVGVFTGGFISNYYNQFYDPLKWPGLTRPTMDTLNPEFGLRYAYFLGRHVGAEVEGSIVAAGFGYGTAALYGLTAQAVFQSPGRLTPFATLGVGLRGVSSSTFGTEANYPIHVGAGVRFYATTSIALRLDVRYLRGPSEQDPYTLNAGYGEFNVGVSWVPGAVTRTAPPDPDPDHDGVLGAADKCPDEAGPGTPDGCPIRDRDHDGILDNVDKCPDEPETVNGYKDDDGCPDTVPDTDGDGIDDLHDKCPTEAEDKDGFQDEDGCPDPDNDKDGVVDAKDKCPNEAGPVENAGCPDVDTDKDGIVDRLDNCPNEPGTEANHGCKAKQLVVITKDQLKILDQVKFQTGTAKLSKASNGLLDNIERVLTAHPTIKKLKVDGFTDNVGKAEMNLKLSQDRAEAVVAYLVKKGVAADRLVATGHGEGSPIGDNKTAKGRAENRRVEFNIAADE